jgi:Holliday junction resolvase RusA-like endonuclease
MEAEPDSPSRIGDALVGNPALQEALNAAVPDFTSIKRLVEEAYAAETGRAIDARDVASWIRHAAQDNPKFDGLVTSRLTPRHVMYADAAAKLQFLARRPCSLCLPYQRVNFIQFTLRTPPVSRQVERSMPFKRAVENYLSRVKYDFTDFFDARLCVAITFALGARGQTPDLDNLAKVLLDALQGYAYRNDRQIDHLDLVRTKTGNDDSFIGIRIAVTGISGNSDTILPEFDVYWASRAGVGPIDLSPYLPG